MEYNLDKCDLSIENNLLMIKKDNNVMNIPIHNVNYVNIVLREKPKLKLYVYIIVGLVLSFIIVGIPLLIISVKKYLKILSQKNRIIINAGNDIVLYSKNDELIQKLYNDIHTQIINR